MESNEARELISTSVLWVRNFHPEIVNSGVFMWEFLKHVKKTPGIQVKTHYVDLRRIKCLAENVRGLRQAARDCDIVHVQYGSVLGLFVGMVLRRRDLVKIITIRGSDWYYLKYKRWNKRIHSFLTTIATRLSLSMFDVVLAVSEKLNSEIVQYGCQSATAVIVGPVDTRSFRIEDKSRARRKLGLDMSRKYVLFASIDLGSEIKRHRNVTLAVSICVRQGFDAEILTATDVSHESMCDLYNAADAICLPSVYEGWPNVIKEALCCGLPFVATDVSDLRVVAEESCGMCLISNPDPGELAEKLSIVLERKLSDVDRKFLRAIGTKIADMDHRTHELILAYRSCQ